MALFDDLPGIIADVLGDASLGFQTITLTSVVAGVYDPATGSASPSTSAQDVQAVVEDYKGLALLPGSNIQAGDKKVTVAALNVTAAPKPGDSVTAGGITYAVVSVATTQPGSTAVIYELQCRKA